jgi:hypothetical protein
MAVVQQLLWSPHYPKSVVVPDAVNLLNLNCHSQTVQTTAAPYVHSQHLRLQHHRFIFLLPRLYSSVSNNVWVVPVLRTFPSPLFSLTPVYAQINLTKQTMPKQRRQQYLTYTATRSHWQFQLSQISQQTVMYENRHYLWDTLSISGEIGRVGGIGRKCRTDSQRTISRNWNSVTVKRYGGACRPFSV